MTTQTHSSHLTSNPPQRVVITGMGAVTPLGLTVDELWQGLITGRSGLGPITRFDASELRSTIAGEVHNFDPHNYMERKEAKRLDLYIQYALAASKEAMADAKLNMEAEDPERVGVIFGSAMGGIQATGDNQTTADQRGLRKVSAFFIPNMLVDSASGRISIEYNAQGMNHAVVSACATGTAACGEAYEILRRGDADVIIAGGSDAAITPLSVAGFDNVGAISQHNSEPTTASRPFDLTRDGFVIAEGAGTLIMESEAHAKARGAHIYAEVIGYGSSGDAYHMTAPHEQSRGAISTMRMALRKAEANGMPIDALDYINAHGTSTHLNDLRETYAIKQVFGERAYTIPISSTKSMTGHLLGAAGAVEAIICAKVIRHGIIPPTTNLHNPDPECDLNYTPLVARNAEVHTALSNSFGFGGHNACLVLRRYEA